MSEPKRPKRLGEKLRAVRHHLGVSQTGMKELLKMKSPYGRISEYERGKRQPTILTILAYAKLAGISMNDLVDDEAELNL